MAPRFGGALSFRRSRIQQSRWAYPPGTWGTGLLGRVQRKCKRRPESPSPTVGGWMGSHPVTPRNVTYCPQLRTYVWVYRLPGRGVVTEPKKNGPRGDRTRRALEMSPLRGEILSNVVERVRLRGDALSVGRSERGGGRRLPPLPRQRIQSFGSPNRLVSIARAGPYSPYVQSTIFSKTSYRASNEVYGPRADRSCEFIVFCGP